MSANITTPTATANPKKDALASDIPDPTNVLLARLENWKQTVNILVDYFETLAATQKHTTAGLEKAKKAVSDAPKFDYAEPSSPTAAGAGAGAGGAPDGSSALSTASGVGGESQEATGIAEGFANLRTKTDALINKPIETEAQFKQAVFPQLATLKGDIEKHLKGLKGPGLKTQKEVEKARSSTQKYIELLGQHVSSFGTGRLEKPKNELDPYVIKREVLASLNEQVIRENTQADSIISTQNNFQTLERHIVQVIQQSVYIVHQTVCDYSSAQIETFQSISDQFQGIQPDHEWNNFVANSNGVLIPEDAQKRELSNLTFSNADHESTIPIIEGILQRKSALVKQYNSGYFVLTPTKFLHQFKSQDATLDPLPEFSLYLPDCSLGKAATQSSGKYKFVITGKEKGTFIAKKHAFAFKASTYSEMVAWHEALAKAVGVSEDATESVTSPVIESPVSETASPVADDASVAATVGTAAPVAQSAEIPITTDHSLDPLAETQASTATATAPETVVASEPVAAPEVIPETTDAELAKKVDSVTL